MSDTELSAEDFGFLADDHYADAEEMMAALSSRGSPFGAYYSDEEDDGGYWNIDDDGDPYCHVIEQKLSKAECRRRRQEISFYRPDRDTEEKSIEWCISNGFEEIEEGLWSGPWYYRHNGLEVPERADGELLPGHEPIPEAPRKPMNQTAFEKAIALKDKGNKEFAAKHYEQACDWYDEALDLFPAASSRLPKQQKAEMAKIHSNKAECLIRLGKYHHAVTEATQALILDKNHAKSRLRRARAVWKGIDRDSYGVNPFAVGQAEEDLDVVIHQGGEGVEDAMKLKEEIEAAIQEDLNGMKLRGYDS